MALYPRRSIPAALLTLAMLIAPATAGAQAPHDNAPGRGRSVVKRVLWSLAGAAAGFGAGLWFGLSKFDQAIDADRKVWTSIAVGTAVGGIAGAVLSTDRETTRQPAAPDEPSERVIEIGLQIFEGLNAHAEPRHAARDAGGGQLIVAVPVLRRQDGQ